MRFRTITGGCFVKVYTVSATCGGGGPGSTTLYVHKSLIDLGFESRVACAICYGFCNDIHVVYGKFGVFLYKISRRLRIRCKLISTIATKKVIKDIVTFSPDIIHIRVIHHSFFNYGLLFSFIQKQDIPVVFTLHDMWLMTGGCYHFIDFNCNKYLTNCCACPKPSRLLDNPVRKVSKEFLRKKDYLLKMKSVTLIAVSKWVQDCFCGSYLENFSNTLIYNAVDLSVFYPRDHKSTGKYIILGSANTWNKQKGIEDFIQLADMLPSGYVIHLIGNIPSDTLLPPNVKRIGHVSSKDRLAELYSDSDVYVCLSYQETFGMTIAEAACCGKKVVGYNTSAIPEVINLAHGVIVETSNLNGILKAIVDICTTHDELTGAELATVRDSFSADRLVKEHIDLYKSLVSN